MNDMTGGFPVDAALAANFRLLQDVDVKLTVEIGSTSLTLRELLALGEASVRTRAEGFRPRVRAVPVAKRIVFRNASLWRIRYPRVPSNL